MNGYTLHLFLKIFWLTFWPLLQLKQNPNGFSSPLHLLILSLVPSRWVGWKHLGAENHYVSYVALQSSASLDGVNHVQNKSKKRTNRRQQLRRDKE